MATPQAKILKDPNLSKGVNLAGLDPAAILSNYSQVFIGNGQQKILLSKDSANSTALADVTSKAKGGILQQIGMTTKQVNTPQAGAGKGGLPSWLPLAGIGAGGLLLLAVVGFVAFKR